MAEDFLRLKGTPTPGEIAGRTTDPRFFAALSILPNPDPILTKAGKCDDVFDTIQADAHVIGELRSIKADFQRFKHTLMPGGERRVDRRAYELCQAFLDRQPAPYTIWPDVIWNIAQSTFRGLSVHEIVWERQGDLIMPGQLLDRPKRRFNFNGFGELRVLTREQPMFGIPAERLYFLVDRHMPTYDNPYGVALFSSCFWPYTFKHAGYRWFVKFCERFGIPFPKGKYPVGASKETIDALEEALQSLLEAGYAALEDGSDVDLMEARGNSAGGKLAQHQLIEACNAEMSKCLTSQTLATEQTSGNGARAATQSHAERAGGVNEGDRDRIVSTLNTLWALITEVNVGGDAVAPVSEFVGDRSPDPQRAQEYQVFINSGGRPSRKAMAEDLGITLENPSDPEDQLTPRANPPAPGGDGNGDISTFARTLADSGFSDQTALDSANLDAKLQPIAQQMLQPLLAALKDGMTPEALKGQLAVMYPQLDDSALQQLIERALFVAMVWGRLTAAGENSNA